MHLIWMARYVAVRMCVTSPVLQILIRSKYFYDTALVNIEGNKDKILLVRIVTKRFETGLFAAFQIIV